VRVPDLVLRSIGFVAEVFGSGSALEDLDPVATCFMISIPSQVSERLFSYYAVTARHVLEKATPNVPTTIMVNEKGGGVKPLQTVGPWIFHPDKTVDVAVIPIVADPTYDITVFAVQDFFDEVRDAELIGAGDEVFFPGLFTAASGIDRITPVVRHGNLAMLPSQQIQTPHGYADIYLIEARSIGGLSGSPVFVRETIQLPVTTNRNDGREYKMLSPGPFKLLGLAQGHWDVDEAEINQAYLRHDPSGVNYGIAKVVPAKKILETLNCPDLTTLRSQLEQDWLSTFGSSSMDQKA
jgi:hypothetical protein